MERKISRRTELEELQHEAGLITDESLESTRRMLNMMEDSEDAGKQTLETLDIQKEQLNRIEKGMDNINADMSQVQKSLNRLKRCCNVCPIPCKKVSAQDYDLKNGNEKSSQIVVDQPKRMNGDKKLNDNINANSSTGYITRITNDAREDEMESNLCQVNSILVNLKGMAVDMNSELSQQNEQIKRINDKGTISTVRLDEVNTTANSLMQNK